MVTTGLALCLSLSVSGTNPEPATIYGSWLFSESSEMSWGIYSFQSTPEIVFTPQWLSGDLMANGGAVYANGNYYILSYLDFGGGFGIGTFSICNVEKQQFDYIDITDWNISYITTDMTFDPATGNVYGCSLDSSGDGSFNLSIMNLENGMQSVIAPMEQMCALAADRNGTLYGISASEGTLCQIDKTTAELTPIGKTGVQPVGTQSATFDPSTQTLYWSAYTEDGGALYQVNTSNGEATLIGTYPDKTQIRGIYIPSDGQQEPGAIENIQLVFEKGKLKGNITFTLPSKDTGGQILSDELTYEIAINGQTTVSGQGMPGQNISETIQVEKKGLYRFTVSVRNNTGSAPAVNIEKFIGTDTPKAVTDISLTADGYTMLLSWELPETGINDGYIDPEQVYYRITRHPDNITVQEVYTGTSFQETQAIEQGMQIRYYTITPLSEHGNGESEESNYVVLGESLPVPIDEDLTDWTRFPLFSTLDCNKDRATWNYSLEANTIRYDWAYGKTNDDWLITPPVQLEAGTNYLMSYDLRSESDQYAAEIEMGIGTEATADAMTEIILPPVRIDHAQSKTYTSEPFTVPTTGLYYLGLHSCGKSSIYYLYADRLRIEKEPQSGMKMSSDQKVQLFTNNGTVYVSNPEQELVQIYTLNGILLYESRQSTFNIRVPQGIYLLKWNENIQKFQL